MMKLHYDLIKLWLQEQFPDHDRNESGATVVEYALMFAAAIGFATLVVGAVTGYLQKIIGSFGG